MLNHPLIIAALSFPAFWLLGLGLLNLLAWLSESTPYPEEKPMEHETPDEYCGCDKPGMARVDYLKFAFMPCGHSRFEWSDLKQQCLQVAKDLGRVKRG